MTCNVIGHAIAREGTSIRLLRIKSNTHYYSLSSINLEPIVLFIKSKMQKIYLIDDHMQYSTAEKIKFAEIDFRQRSRNLK